MDDKLTVKFRGEDRILFASYLRLNSWLRVVGNAGNIPNILVDPDLSENILRVALAEKGGAGEMFSFELVEGDVSNEDADRILFWAQDHLTDFFMRRLQKINENAAELEPKAKALESQLVGLAS